MSEQRFEYRLQRILEEAGFLVINCARSKPFDLIAIKDQVAYPIEVKGKNTRYPESQMDYQITLCDRVNTCFFIIKQSKKRGKMRLETLGASNPCDKYLRVLQEALKPWLES